MVQERQQHQAAFRLSEERRCSKVQDCRQHRRLTKVLHLAQGREARKNEASAGLGWEEPNGIHSPVASKRTCLASAPVRHRDFDLALDNVWYGRLALLFKMTVRTDSNELLDVECAMVDVLFFINILFYIVHILSHMYKSVHTLLQVCSFAKFVHFCHVMCTLCDFCAHLPT